MKRRTAGKGFDVATVPDELLKFRVADWADETAVMMPAGFAFGQSLWRQVHAHSCWLQARQRWLADQGLIDDRGWVPRDIARALQDEQRRRWPVVDVVQ